MTRIANVTVVPVCGKAVLSNGVHSAALAKSSLTSQGQLLGRQVIKIPSDKAKLCSYDLSESMTVSGSEYGTLL